MGQIHNKLLHKSSWYAFWHKQSYHQAVQWLVLVIVLGGVGLAIVFNFKPGLLGGLQGQFGSAAGTTYYVSNTGSNANNGTSASTPWQTIAKVNSSTFSAGDSILFKKGDTWRETLTLPASGSAGNVITFGAYGSGANPIISGSNLITGWTADGQSNTWNATVTTAPNIVYLDGTFATLVASKAAITSANKWFWAANVLSIYSTSDADTAFTSPGVESGTRTRAIDYNERTYITVDGLTLRDSNSMAVEFGYNTVTGLTIQNSIVERSSGDGIQIGGVTATSFTINNNTIQNNGGFGVRVDGDFAAGTISNNVVSGNGWGSVRDNQQYSGIQGHLGNLNIFGNTVHDNAPVCNGFATCHGIYHALNAGLANIYENIVYNNPNGSGIKVASSANIYRNLTFGNGGSGIEAGQNGTTNVVFVIYSNVIHSNNSDGSNRGIVEQAKGSGTLSISIYNNTIYKNGGTTTEEIAIGDNVTVLNIKNNLLWATDTRRTIRFSVTQTGTVAVNNNLHWRADGNPDIIHNGSATSWAQWQALGYDVNGVNANPLFTSPTTDFTLQATSPAINVGANLGSTYQTGLLPGSVWPSAVLTGNQNSYGAGWEMGAYIYPGATPPPPDTTPPTVSMTAPSNDATVSGSSVTVTATASDNVGVAGVQYKLDTTTNLGAEDTSSPYSISWNTTGVADGSHTLTAVARDGAGNSTTSAAVTVTVNNVVTPPPDTTPPTIPGNLRISSGPTQTSVTVAWNASIDTGGSGLAGYHLYRNNVEIASPSPSTTSYQNTALTPATTYTYAISAYDAAGNGSPASNNLTVVTLAAPDTTPPGVSLTAPSNGATVSGTVTVTASASDNVSVSGVQFKLDGANLGAEDTSSPYSTSWNTTSASAGSHALTAIARDAAGNTTLATTITVTVNNTPPGPAPTITTFKLTGKTDTTATIFWKTNQATTGIIRYGTSKSNLNLQKADPASAISHTLTLTNLTPRTTYYYQITATNANGSTTSVITYFRTRR